jgi:S-(hydroxymethyl)mycothiol dehydrogenase
MPQTVRGVIARAKGAPVTVENVIVPDPGPGEAIVKIQACGVCHTDLHYREGGINDEFPFLLGHEAAGVVESVGEGVTNVEPGDYVILNWRAVCGNCRSCLKGKPWYCFSTFNATQKMTLEDGTELSRRSASVRSSRRRWCTPASAPRSTPPRPPRPPACSAAG